MSDCESIMAWIRLHEDVIYNEIWQRDITAWHIFEYLCLMAYRGKPQGTVVTSRYKIANATFGNNNTVYKALKRLEKAEMVTMTATSLVTTIRICNWNKWQLEQQPLQEQPSNNQVTTEQHSYKNKKENKEKNTNVFSSTDVDIKALFSELIGILGYTDAVKYTDGRKRKLQARVRAGSADELRRAAQAISADEYMQGDNPAGRRYGDIDYLIRSDEQVDKWIQKAKQQVTYKADW